MAGISKKIQLLIDGGSVNKWAEDHGLPPQTVHGWIKQDRMPRHSGLKLLIEKTGISEDWWRHGKGPPPGSPKPYSNSEATQSLTGSGEYNGLRIQQRQVPSNASRDSVSIPCYDAKASAGHGSTIGLERVIDHFEFKKEWLRKTLGVSPNDLALIYVKGDSMEPVLKDDDLILIDLSKGRLSDNAIYVLQYDGDLLVKRIQRLLDGGVVVKSDNPTYRTEEVHASKVQTLHVLGRVVWFARKM